MNLNIIRYCAEEVDRQQDGPLAVYWMVNAWEWAQEHRTIPVDLDIILKIGALVHPPKNMNGFRVLPVRVGNHIPPAASEVFRLMGQLVNAHLKPSEFYKEFQGIHPFLDGNGRTGKILFNWLSKTLDDPIMPPNFWGIANP